MKEKVNVTGVPETMVQTLYARAKETRKKNAKINDEIAVELVKKLDYDLSLIHICDTIFEMDGGRITCAKNDT